jgi:hypothetical protein
MATVGDVFLAKQQRVAVWVDGRGYDHGYFYKKICFLFNFRNDTQI